MGAWTPDIELGTDISDQSSGYAAFDVLYISAIRRYDQATNLRLIHRMARIETILKAGEGITEEELEDATVTIFEDPLTHSTAGLISSGDRLDGEIKPYHNVITKKYEALVSPQDMTGKPFIRIGVGSNDFTYIPETETAGKFGLFSDKRYAYTIAVKASGIEMATAKGGTWNTGGSENVSVTIVYDGTETEPKTGDYYYSDSTQRDGGLRKLHADGMMERTETELQLENGKNVIAIVLRVGHHEDDASDYSTAGIGQQKRHGYTVALQDAINGYCQRGVYGTELDCCLTDGSGKRQNNYSILDINWSGYAWTQKIVIAAGGKDKLSVTEDSGCPATYCAVMDYAHKVPSPANGTGWFLPFTGQMWNVY